MTCWRLLIATALVASAPLVLAAGSTAPSAARHGNASAAAASHVAVPRAAGIPVSRTSIPASWTVSQTTIEGKPATVVNVTQREPLTDEERTEIIKAGYRLIPACTPYHPCTGGAFLPPTLDLYCLKDPRLDRFDCFTLGSNATPGARRPL